MGTWFFSRFIVASIVAAAACSSPAKTGSVVDRVHDAGSIGGSSATAVASSEVRGQGRLSSSEFNALLLSVHGSARHVCTSAAAMFSESAGQVIADKTARGDKTRWLFCGLDAVATGGATIALVTKDGHDWLATLLPIGTGARSGDAVVVSVSMWRAWITVDSLLADQHFHGWSSDLGRTWTIIKGPNA